MRPNPARPLAWPLLLVAVMFFLATVFPATKWLSRDLSPLTISLLRYGFAVLGTAIGLFAWYRMVLDHAAPSARMPMNDEKFMLSVRAGVRPLQEIVECRRARRVPFGQFALFM
jgi:drug/metabolite transporter (DMT)-like permease